MIVRARITVGPPLVLHGRAIRVVDLDRIVAADAQLLQVVVRQVPHHLEQPRIGAPEVLAQVRAVFDDVALVLAVDDLAHALARAGLRCRARAASSQSEPQSTLMTFQPAPRNTASSSWMIWPLPRTGPSSRCRLQLMTKIRLSSFSRAASEIDAERFGLVRFAVAEERPDLLIGRRLQAAVLQVLRVKRAW